MGSDDERPRSSYSAGRPTSPAGDPVDPVLPEVRLDERIRRIADEIATAGELTGDEAYAMIHNAITGPAPLQQRIDELTAQLAERDAHERDLAERIWAAVAYTYHVGPGRGGEEHEHEPGVECWPCNMRRLLLATPEPDGDEVNPNPGTLAHLAPQPMSDGEVGLPVVSALLNTIAASAQEAFGRSAGFSGQPFLPFSTRYNFARGVVEDLRCAGYRIVPIGDDHAPG